MRGSAYTPSSGAESFAGTDSVNFAWMGSCIKKILSAAIKTLWTIVSTIYAHERSVSITVLNVCANTTRSRSIRTAPGLHASKFKITLYQYYSGLTVHENSIEPQSQLRRRAPNIFGLDLVNRGHERVISIPAPDYSPALAKSPELGELVYRSMLGT